MKFELWQDKLEDSYTLLEALPENPSADEQRRYKFMTTDSKFIIGFNCESFDEAMVMRNNYLGWK